MKRILSYIFPALLLLTLISCEGSFHDGRFLGTWVSTDNLVLTNNPDTLTFANEDFFSKSLGDNMQHPYKYSYDENSITILYYGTNLVLVQSTTHSYNLKNNELIIDFSNGSYGFDSKKITYIKQ